VQVYILKTDLSQTIVPVYGIYPDIPSLDRNMMGTTLNVLTLPPEAVQSSLPALPTDPASGPISTVIFSQLASNWRTYTASIVRNEAQRRILESFSEFMQRNAANDLTKSITLYGTNSSTWPQDAQDRKAEADRGWAYVSAVRVRSDAMETSMPTDPTADSAWPTRISQIYIPSV
jgi:hypothetical protein